jgi:hypothetical protein
MLRLGYYLFGLMGTASMLLPVILVFSTGRWPWLFGLIPAFLVSRGFYAISGYCKAREIEKATGMDVKTQAKLWRWLG